MYHVFKIAPLLLTYQTTFMVEWTEREGERREGGRVGEGEERENEREPAGALGGGQPQLKNDTLFWFMQCKTGLSSRLWKTLHQSKIKRDTKC